MKPTRLKRTSSVVIAVTLQRLLEDATRFWEPDELLVLDALRRSKKSLEDASTEELAAYVESLRPDQLRGVMSNVKGIYHELLFVQAENLDGDELSARVFEETNHPGADVEFIMEGEVIRDVQLKAVSSASTIIEHLRRYPDIDVRATSEVAGLMSNVESSGFSNATLTRDVDDVVSDLEGDSALDELNDGLTTSALVSAAFAAGKMVRKRSFSEAELKTVFGDVVVGGTAAVFLDMLIE